jgi:hypothetical protein
MVMQAPHTWLPAASAAAAAAAAAVAAVVDLSK